VSEDLDGFAIGGGIQYNWDELNGVRLGYTLTRLTEQMLT